MIPQTALTIGTFDGVHLGHAELLATARRAVGASGRVVAASFDPSPMAVLRPGSAPSRLSSTAQRTRWLREAGADEIELLTPEPALLALPPEEFIARMTGRWQPSVVVEGPDFRFGRRRAGSIETLAALGERFGFRSIVVPSVEAELVDQTIVPVRSTMIRWLLERGRVADAARLLGRPFELECPVVRGAQRGRDLGVPTANLDHGSMLLPADGVYSGVAVLPDGSSWPAAISIGTNPTFGDITRRCEVHVVDWSGELDQYGWTLRVSFLAWMRDQINYPGIEPLLAQIARDLEQARKAALRSQPISECIR